jgi:hypothetical protein
MVQPAGGGGCDPRGVEKMNPQYPALDPKDMAALEEMKKALKG